MAQKYMNISRENNIAIVEINHAPANALSSACISALRNAFNELDRDDGTHAIILTGAGRFFAAGADIKEFVKVFDDEAGASTLAENGQNLCNEIEAMRKPVIAAINGPALGGGMEVAMSCHIRVAAKNAIMGLPELKLGLIPTFGGTKRLTKMTNIATAVELILTGKQLSAEEAQKLDIVQLVTEQEELLPAAIAIASSLNEGKSLTSISRAIQCIAKGAYENLEDSLEREREMFAQLFSTYDAKEGIQAFIEKRQPEFKHQ